MQKILLVGLFFFISIYTFSQTENQLKIQQLNEEITKAVEVGNYTKANQLKQERELRFKMEEAIEKEDFIKASELEEKIKSGSYRSDNKPIKSTEESMYINSDYYKHKSLKSGFYFNFSLGHSYTEDLFYSRNAFNIGFDLGNRFTKKSDKQKRFGLDMNWFNFSISVENLNAFLLVEGSFVSANFHIANPGVFYSEAFNKDQGLEASLHIGPGVTAFNGDGYLNLGFYPRILYRYKVIGIGLSTRLDLMLQPGSGYHGMFIGITPTFSLKF